jgi:hypothetical protein
MARAAICALPAFRTERGKRKAPTARCRLAVRAVGEDFESENPQNVAAPLRLPSAALSVRESVAVQLEAAQRNNSPRADHGVHVLYEFALEAGSMERSRYFGFSKGTAQPARHGVVAPSLFLSLWLSLSAADLYHLDHFLGITAVYPQLFDSDCACPHRTRRA